MSRGSQGQVHAPSAPIRSNSSSSSLQGWCTTAAVRVAVGLVGLAPGLKGGPQGLIVWRHRLAVSRALAVVAGSSPGGSADASQ